MKIVFGLGNRGGAALQLSRCYPKIKDKHEIKVAAFPGAIGFSFPISWNLESLHYAFTTRPKGKTLKFWQILPRGPLIDLANAESLTQEISNFGPDLIISDGDRITASVAAKLKIPLWYASALNSLTHINRSLPSITGSHYSDFFRPFTNSFLKYWPKAERNFVLSPWGAFNKLTLKEKGEWLFPEFENLSCSEASTPKAFCWDHTRRSSWNLLGLNLDFPLDLLGPDDYPKLGQAAWAWISGETPFITDVLLAGIPLNIAPDLNDIEQLINAYFAEYHQVGADLRQVELMDRYAINFLAEVEKTMPTTYLPIQKTYPTLAEILCKE